MEIFKKNIFSYEIFVMILSVVFASLLSILSSLITSKYMIHNQEIMLADKNAERRQTHLNQEKLKLIENSKNYYKLINNVLLSINYSTNEKGNDLETNIDIFNRESSDFILLFPEELREATSSLNMSLYNYVNYQKISDLQTLQDKLNENIKKWYDAYFETRKKYDSEIYELYK